MGFAFCLGYQEAWYLIYSPITVTVSPRVQVTYLPPFPVCDFQFLTFIFICLGFRGFIVPNLRFHFFELGVVEIKNKSKQNVTAPSLSIDPSGEIQRLKQGFLPPGGHMTHRGAI